MFKMIETIGAEKLNLLILLIFSVGYLFFKRDTLKNFPKLNKKYLTEKPSQRVSFFDFVKGLAIVAVIIIHATYLVNLLSNNFSFQLLRVNEAVNRIMRFAVLIFFISSGALLTLKDSSKIKDFYIEKAKKIIPIYALFSFFATGLTINELSFFKFLLIGTYEFISGTSLISYWFIPVLIQLYLIFPFIWHLLVIKNHDPKKILLFSFIISFLSHFLLPYGGIFNGLRFLFFFVFGITLKPLFFEKNRKWLKEINIASFFILIVILYLFVGSFYLTSRFYNVRFFYGPAIMLLLFYFYPHINNFIRNTFEKVGQNTFYIYLFHLFPMYLLYRVVDFSSVRYFWILISFIIAGLLPSLIFVMIINKIKKSGYYSKYF